MSSGSLTPSPFNINAEAIFDPADPQHRIASHKGDFESLDRRLISQVGGGVDHDMFGAMQQLLATPQMKPNAMGTGYQIGNVFIPNKFESAANLMNNTTTNSVAGGGVGVAGPQLDTSGLNGAITNLTAAINKLSQSVGGGVTGAPSAVAGAVAGGHPALASLPAGFFEGQTKVAGGPLGLAPIPAGFFEGLPAISSPDTRVHTSAGAAIASFNSGSLRPITTAPDARVFVNTGRAVPSFDSNIGFGTISPDARTGGAGAVASFNSGVAQHTNLNFPQPPSSLPVISPLSGVGTAVSSFNSGFVSGGGASIHSFPQANNVVFHAPSVGPPAEPPPVDISALGMLGSTPATQGQSGAGQQLLSGLRQHYGPDFDTPAPAFTPIPKATPSTSGHSIRGAFISGLAGGMVHQDHTFMQRQAVRVGRRLEQGLFSATRQAMDMDTGRTISETLAQLPAGARALSRGLQILDEQTNIQVPVNRALARAELGFPYPQESTLKMMVESGFMDLPDAAEFIATTSSLAGDATVVEDLFFAHQIGEDAEGQAGLMGMLNARGMFGKTVTNQAVQRARKLGVRGAAVTEAANVEVQAILEERTSGVGTRGRGGRRGIIAEADARGGRDMQLNIASIKRGRSQILRARNLITDPFKGVGEALLFAHALEVKDGDQVEAHHFLSDMSVSEKTSLFRSIGGRGLSDMLRLQGGEERGDLGPAGARINEGSVTVPQSGLSTAIERGKSQMAMRERFESKDMQGINKVRIQKELDLDKGQLDRMQKVINETSDDFNTHVGKLITRVREVEEAMDTAAQKINAAVKKMSFDVDPNDKGVMADMKKLANIFSVILAKAGLNALGVGLSK